MKNSFLLTFLTFLFFFYGNAQDNLWKKISEREISDKTKIERNSSPSEYQILNLELTELINILESAPSDNEDIKSKTIIPVPTLSNEMEYFEVYNSSVMDKELSKKYPEIRSYLGKSTSDPTSYIRFSITPFGLHLVNYSADNGTIYIDPYTTDLKSYIVYNTENLKSDKLHSCETDEGDRDINHERFENTLYNEKTEKRVFRTYRLAISCTPEYANYQINNAKYSNIPVNTDEEKKKAVLSAFTVTTTRVNSIYERDLGVRLKIVANNDKLINLKHNKNFDSKINSDLKKILPMNQKVIDSLIGKDNYDIGHIFSTGGGGLAMVGVVCVNGMKAQGATGSTYPIGDPFDVDFVSHEIGHQLGAYHTFNNNCVDSQIGKQSSVEPGSGTSIMAYAGVCEQKNQMNNIQYKSDPYFHSVSISQILNTLTYYNCSTNTDFKNPAIEVNAGEDKVIPKDTPFKLTGSATDPINQKSLTYSWEQMDKELNQQPPVSNATKGPVFRIYQPTTSPTRYFPKWTLVSQNISDTWEVLPTVARTLNFTLIVRNNNVIDGGQTGTDNIVVKVANTGPFRITYPNSDNIAWKNNSTQTITWDVAGTTANEIKTNYVNISISTDNGINFIPLLNNTPNDGNEKITVPDTTSDNCRILIEPVNNIYYALSKSFKISPTGTASIEEYGLNDFILSPNPTDGVFKVSFKSNTNNDIIIRVNDLGGRLILNNTYKNTGSFSQEINIGDVQSGIYLISIEDGNNKEVKKVIKK